jgi:hypothetical protein
MDSDLPSGQRRRESSHSQLRPVKACQNSLQGSRVVHAEQARRKLRGVDQVAMTLFGPPLGRVPMI